MSSEVETVSSSSQQGPTQTTKNVPDESAAGPTPVPDNEAVNVPKEKDLVEQLGKVVAEVKEVLPSTVKEIRRMNRILDDFEKEDSFEAHEDPVVRFEIKALKQKFREVAIHSERFVVASKNLAKFASNDRHINRIKDDLEKGSVKKLKRFLNDTSGYIERCLQRLKEFQDMYDELNQRAVETIGEQAGKIEKQNERVADFHHVSIGVGVGAGVAGVTTGVAAGFGIGFAAASASVVAAPITLPLSIICFVISGISATATASSAGVAIGFRIAKSISTKQREILEKAAQALSQLQDMMYSARTRVLKIERHINDAAECIEGSEKNRKFKGLKELADNPECDEDGELESLFDIEQKLDEVKEAMEKVLKIIESESDEDNLQEGDLEVQLVGKQLEEVMKKD